jgi:leucyl aminopeptidase
MQKIDIRKISSHSYSENLVFLVEKGAELTPLQLTDEETEFVKKELDNKATQVFLNRYKNWIFIQFIDKTKNIFQSKESLRRGGFSIGKHIQKHKDKKVVIADYQVNADFVLALTEGLLLSNYQFSKYLKDGNEKGSLLQQIEILSEKLSDNDIYKLGILVEAVCTARDWVNEPASALTSVRLSEEIQKLGKEAGFSTQVFDKSKIESLKMGGLLAVNQGSTKPPTFSILEWKPENALNTKPIVLVGKGIVYDSGGYSLKTTKNSMDSMKSDMAGAAAVALLIYTIAKTKLPLHVVGLIPSTDNRIGPDAYSPGDVITMYDGTTVEVMNTDAEGRLILADALSYAKQYDPELVIDLATLTGAAHRAIGEIGVVGMGNAPEEVIKEIVDAGNDVHERVAVFPFWEEYGEMVKSDIADLTNTGPDLAGAITAGKFLEYFTNYPYFHLDIAGMAFISKSDGYRGPGATGIGVRLLNSFLNKYASNLTRK